MKQCATATIALNTYITSSSLMSSVSLELARNLGFPTKKALTKFLDIYHETVQPEFDEIAISIKADSFKSWKIKFRQLLAAHDLNFKDVLDSVKEQVMVDNLLNQKLKQDSVMKANQIWESQSNRSSFTNSSLFSMPGVVHRSPSPPPFVPQTPPPIIPSPLLAESPSPPKRQRSVSAPESNPIPDYPSDNECADCTRMSISINDLRKEVSALRCENFDLKAENATLQIEKQQALDEKQHLHDTLQHLESILSNVMDKSCNI